MRLKSLARHDIFVPSWICALRTTKQIPTRERKKHLSSLKWIKAIAYHSILFGTLRWRLSVEWDIAKRWHLLLLFGYFTVVQSSQNSIYEKWYKTVLHPWLTTLNMKINIPITFPLQASSIREEILISTKPTKFPAEQHRRMTIHFRGRWSGRYPVDRRTVSKPRDVSQRRSPGSNGFVVSSCTFDRSRAASGSNENSEASRGRPVYKHKGSPSGDEVAVARGWQFLRPFVPAFC